MQSFDLKTFINKNVTGRETSLFAPDLAANETMLRAGAQEASVLVIGGAGTIGSSFIKALLPYQPARLVVVDTNENALTELVRDLRSSAQYKLPADFITYPFDFGDPVFAKFLQREGPFDIVANFAAHKHVRSEKDHYSVEAMLRNNVLKNKQLLDLLTQKPPTRLFCVSTDKATDPVNVMGASKKLMEEVLLSHAGAFTISTARFANVAFSNGSLPAGFLERLRLGQPLSAPADVRRYFVSPEESGQLCLLACLLGESRDIFFPKLDETHDQKRFSDIAEALLRSFGYTPDYCLSETEARDKAAFRKPGDTTWPVYYFTSDTTGEKMSESFFSGNEIIDSQRFKNIGCIKATALYTAEDMHGMFQEMEYLFAQPALDKPALIQLLERWVPGFRHHETGKGLDSKM